MRLNGIDDDKTKSSFRWILVRLKPLTWYIIANSSYQKPASYAYEVNSKINYSTNIISLNFYLSPTEPSELGINLSLLVILLYSSCILAALDK